ncbi:hypothetical protein FGO68_gene10341 [Halteria grandinella]|uniref:1-alkyl-2-acetylglycerophosphocholine esterase n=1 Tax=Halteria grandinella TaxID=5974 RepID=A0A8J8NDU1_HALGN|nr:hypothetical protein FGO68_gene10341 [Halteria grandinella]
MTSVTFWARRTYGTCDFQKYPDSPEAPYACGFTTIRTSKYGNEVQVYYPISKESANRQKFRDSPFLPHGHKTMRGLSLLAKLPTWLGPWLLRYYYNINLDVFVEAPLASRFNGKPLIPIFFSHSLGAFSNMFSRLHRDLARHGYIVFTINHLDGTCTHAVDKDDKDIYFGARTNLTDHKELRGKQLRIRENELRQLIQEVCFDDKREILKQTSLSEWIQFDIDKITTFGHSFGGITALRAAYLDPRVKAVLALDPWMFLHLEDIDAGTFAISAPHVTINTENFDLKCFYKSNRYIQTFQENSKTKYKEGIIVKRIAHALQQDLCCINPIELCLSTKEKLHSDLSYLYFMHGQLMLAFLDQIGFNKTFKADTVHKRVEEFKDQMTIMKVHKTE